MAAFIDSVGLAIATPALLAGIGGTALLAWLRRTVRQQCGAASSAVPPPCPVMCVWRVLMSAAAQQPVVLLLQTLTLLPNKVQLLRLWP